MAEKRTGGRAGVVFLALIALVYLVSGCSIFTQGTRAAAPRDTSQAENEAAPLYYDFEDILLPRELKADKKASFVFRTPRMSAGVLTFKGRVEGASLIAFFENNMAKDNWKFLGLYKAVPNTIILFQKETRSCMIKIIEKKLTTYVEIWAAPSIARGPSGLIK